MFRRIINKIFYKIIHKHFRVWGVEIESDLPPEFYVTTHAEKRMCDRMGCRLEKISKLVIKAWKSEEKIDQNFINRKMYFRKDERGIVYRKLMGFIFVFKVTHTKGLYSQKRLITVY